MTGERWPSPDEVDRELAAMCDTAAVQALADGEDLLADFLWQASTWHATRIRERRCDRILAAWTARQTADSPADP